MTCGPGEGYIHSGVALIRRLTDVSSRSPSAFPLSQHGEGLCYQYQTGDASSATQP
jgi:hypothetical protein